MDKSRKRKQAINHLKQMTENEKFNIEKKMESHITSSLLWKKAKVIGLTVSKDFEWDTWMLIKQAWEEKKQVVIPKCIPNNKKMNFYMINSASDLILGNFNILEPKVNEEKRVNKNDIDLLIVPGVLFDKQGYRIGFGGGYYDRFLVDYSNATLSMSSEENVINELPKDPYDMSVQHIVTENGFI